MQPIIGITMCIDENKLIKRNADHNYVRREYGEAVRRAGAQPIFIDPSIDPLVAAKMCDGIVLSGGEDIDPALYGKEKIGEGVQEPRTRTDWERQLIDACNEWSRPILGICYGQQLLNVHYGGTLYQDITIERQSAVDHGTSEQASFHEIQFEKDFLGYVSGEKLPVAARHHQAINQVAPGFSVVARSADSGVEAIEGRGHFGVQWHSECDETAVKIYGNFVQKCIAQGQPARAVHQRPKVLSRILTRFR